MVNTNLDSRSRNANVDNTTVTGNADGIPEPEVPAEGPASEYTPIATQSMPEPEPEGDDEEDDEDDEESIDPDEHTVAQVMQWVTEHPDQRDAVLEDEQAGKRRVTLVDWLKAQEPEIP